VTSALAEHSAIMRQRWADARRADRT
jgi:hypothetical protein